MSWKITCIQKAAVGVQLIHYCGEKWFTIARFKGSAAIRAKLTSLLKTPSYHPHQRAFKNCLPSFRGRLVRGGVLDQRFTEVKIKHFIISQGRGEVNNAISVLSTVLFWSLRKNTFILSVLFVGLYIRAIGNYSSLEIWPLWSHAQCANCSVSALWITTEWFLYPSQDSWSHQSNDNECLLFFWLLNSFFNSIYNRLIFW